MTGQAREEEEEHENMIIYTVCYIWMFIGRIIEKIIFHRVHFVEECIDI